MDSITLRSVTPQDEEFLYALYSSTRAKEMTAWGWPDAQRREFLRMQFAARLQGYRTDFPLAEHHLILVGESPVGRIYVDRAGPCLFLVDISLLPVHQHQGIGTSLLRGLQEEAASAGKALRLHVDRQSPVVQWYEKLGFVSVAHDDVYLEMEFSPMGALSS